MGDLSKDKQQIRSIKLPGNCHMANGANHINFIRGTDDATLIFVHGFARSLEDCEEQCAASTLLVDRIGLTLRVTA